MDLQVRKLAGRLNLQQVAVVERLQLAIKAFTVDPPRRGVYFCWGDGGTSMPNATASLIVSLSPMRAAFR